MGGFSLDDAVNQFHAAAQTYSTTMQPYALKLFFGLFLIDLIVTFVQYTADGGLDPISYLGRFVRQILGAGFVLAMIIHGFDWMTIVINSFGELGRIITGLPPVSPDSIASAGVKMATTIWNSPTTGGIVSALELAVIEAILGFVVFCAFIFVAIELLYTLVKGYLAIGVGVIALSFGGSRFTSRGAEGYFTTALRVGIKLLFFYAVLGIGMQLVNQWETALNAACNPTTTALPWITTYFTPPSTIMSTVCTGTIGLSDMAMYALLAAMFAALGVGVPHMAAELIGGPIGHALEDIAAAYYFGRNAIAPVIGGAARGAAGAARGAVNGVGAIYRHMRPSEITMQNFAADMAAQARARSATKSTTPLSPFNGQPPGYNMRPPSSPRPPAGPGLPPSNGSGSGGAALEYYPGRPGAQTRAEAVDITKLQGKQGGN